MTKMSLTWPYQVSLFGVRKDEGSKKTMKCVAELSNALHMYEIRGTPLCGWTKLDLPKKFAGFSELSKFWNVEIRA